MALINVNKQILSKAHIQNRCKIPIKLHIFRERKEEGEKVEKNVSRGLFIPLQINHVLLVTYMLHTIQNNVFKISL